MINRRNYGLRFRRWLEHRLPPAQHATKAPRDPPSAPALDSGSHINARAQRPAKRGRWSGLFGARAYALTS